MASEGSAPTGPSEAYLQLLKGRITPEDYVKCVKKRVSDQRQDGGSGQPTRAAPRRKQA